MENIKFATIVNGAITLEFNPDNGYVYAVCDNGDVECLIEDGTFTDVDNACNTMKRLYRSNVWNFHKI